MVIFLSQVQSGRSKRVKVDGLLSKSGPSLGKHRSVQVDGPKESKWTVRKYQSGRFKSAKSAKTDGPKVFRTQSTPYPLVHPTLTVP